MRLSWQEYWSGFLCALLGALSNPGTEPTSLTSPKLAGEFLTLVPRGNSLLALLKCHICSPYQRNPAPLQTASSSRLQQLHLISALSSTSLRTMASQQRNQSHSYGVSSSEVWVSTPPVSHEGGSQQTGSELKVSYRTTVPNSFGVRDRFHGRQFFHRWTAEVGHRGGKGWFRC